MTTGEKIRMLREESGISQVELGERIGESKQTIYKYEHDIIYNIPRDKIEAIADILDVSPAYLFNWQENRYRVTRLTEVPSDIASVLNQAITEMAEQTRYPIDVLTDELSIIIKGFADAINPIKKAMLNMADDATKTANANANQPAEDPT